MFIDHISFQTLTTSAAALFSSSEDEEDQSAPMKNPLSGRAQFVSLYSILSVMEL